MPKKCPCQHFASVHQTVFVDNEFGSNRKARLNSPGCPFRTITAAVNAVTQQTPSFTSVWTIQVSPGIYKEVVDLPFFVNLNGSGENSTIISGLKLNGTSTVSNLTIRSSKTPLLQSNINNTSEEQNQARLYRITLEAKNVIDTNSIPIVTLNGSGLNNNTILTDCTLNGNILSSNANDQVVFDINSMVSIQNLNLFVLTDYKSITSVFQGTGKLFIDGGNFELRVSDGPAKEVSLFKTTSSYFSVTNNTSAILILVTQHPYQADVSYTKVEGNGIISVQNSTAFLDGVSRDFLNLAESTSNLGQIDLLSVSTPNISVPRIKGFTDNINYVAQSGDGDVVASGGLYANIITVSAPTGTTGLGDYYVQENDFTILANGVNVHVFDPVLANQQVLDKGKIINIKNIGSEEITIDSQDNTIFEGSIVLLPIQCVTLQNDGVKWYTIGRLLF